MEIFTNTDCSCHSEGPLKVLWRSANCK